MKKRGITVKRLLGVLNEDRQINVVLFAYGQFYASTLKDGMNTVKECLDRMNSHCLNAWVFDMLGELDGSRVIIKAEIVHD